MNRLRNIFHKDLILGFKDMFILLEVAFAVIIVFVLLFLIPKDIKNEGTVFVYDASGLIENFIEDFAADKAKKEGEFFLDGREEVIEGMVENRSALGIIITQNESDKYTVELLTQPYTIQKLVRYIDLEIEDLLSVLKPPYGVYPADVYETVRIESLQWGSRDDLPFNQRLLPSILMMMVGIIGMFAMISLVGQERADLTIRAFRISPGTLLEFIISKHAVILLTGYFSFSVLYIPIMGLNGYLESLLIMVLTILMGSSIGVILGSFFKEPMAAMLWILLLTLILALPAVSLFAPIFSPDWLKIIPSYHTLFSLDAAMFPDNNRHIIWQGALVLGVINIILLPLSAFIFTKVNGKEA
jgi:hypothetical protein